MELSRATELLATLADGVNPLTGEVLSSDELCNQGEIVRALYTVLAALTSEKKSKRPLPENAGKPWTSEDDSLLTAMYDAGCTNRDMCLRLKRTNTALAARLVRLGIIETREAFRNRK